MKPALHAQVHSSRARFGSVSPSLWTATLLSHLAPVSFQVAGRSHLEGGEWSNLAPGRCLKTEPRRPHKWSPTEAIHLNLIT